MSLDVVGLTGHQGLATPTTALVHEAIKRLLASSPPFLGLCSLAEGADQIFADLVLQTGSALHVVVPCDGYERTFTEETSLKNYRRLLAAAASVEVMPFNEPIEDAFFAAGREVARRASTLLAVWDGKSARGTGGTADVVDYARTLGKPVIIVWPEGSTRG